MIHRTDVAVIGAGPAGVSAAVQCTRLGLSGALFDETGRAGGLAANAWSIENDPSTGGPLSGPRFVARLEEHLQRFGLCPIKEKIRSVQATEGGFLLEGSHGSHTAKAVILATGTTPRRAGFEGEDIAASHGLWYHVVDLAGRAPGEALVVGGGEAALDYALSLASWGWAVTVLVRGDGARANLRLLEAVRGEAAITLRAGSEVTRVEPSRGSITATIIDGEGTTITRADAMVVAVGRARRLPALLDRDGSPLDLPSGGPVLTCTPGLGIAGDARLGSLGQVGVAIGDGLEAARQCFVHIRSRERH